jgi:hypothetical protein
MGYSEGDLMDLGEGVDELGMPNFPVPPTDAELEHERQTTPAEPYEESSSREDEEEDSEDDEAIEAAALAIIKRKRGDKNSTKEGMIALVKVENAVPGAQRQMLLFSATAIKLGDHSKANRSAAFALGKKSIKDKDIRTRLGTLSAGCPAIKTLPQYLQKMVAGIGSQNSVSVCDVTGTSFDGNIVPITTNITNGSSSSSNSSNTQVKQVNSLPSTLSHQEMRVTPEDKDSMAYYFMLRHRGRCLVFVNSIDSARRLDALFRALGLPSRTVHAQLQQRQRLRALEAFQSAPVGVLVATDVAARGLDIPKIQYVLHYDVARSPQVYIHRSGRAARAGLSGTAVSLVTPLDMQHYKRICDHLGRPSLQTLRPDLAAIPLIRKRTKAAKTLFTRSFVQMSSAKEDSWMAQQAKEAGLEMDDYLVNDKGTQEEQQGKSKIEKRKLAVLRAELQGLLDEPVGWSDGTSVSQKKKGFVVVNGISLNRY